MLAHDPASALHRATKHLGNGKGSPPDDACKGGFVGNFLKVPGAREFLTHEDGMAGKGFPCILSQGTMLNLPGTHAEQINAMRVKGIAIEDRMND